jgi:hypothetical protein
VTKYISFILLAATAPAWTQSVITTYAGNGAGGFSGDGGPATQATVNNVVGLATDAAGNLYLADQNNNRVRIVTTDANIATFAGNGVAGFSGDGGLATQASLNYVTGVCVAPAGDVYINDLGNYRVRKVAAGTGIITTVAGNGSSVAGGDNGPATAAGMQLPIRCAVDSSGNLYIVDQGNSANVVRKVDANGVITLYAGVYGGTGFSGDGGPATSATMFNLTAGSFDSANNLYLTDQGDQRIRLVDTNGNINTVVGVGSMGFSGDGGPATSAQLNQPGETAIDGAGNLFLLDVNNQRVREVSGGVISTVVGTGVAGYGGDGGPPLQAQINGAFALALDPCGNMYIADLSNNVIRKVTGLAAANANACPPAATSPAPQLSALSLSASQTSSGTAVQGTVSLTGPAPAGGATVTLSSNSAAASVTPSVTIPAGLTFANFTVTVGQVTSTQMATLVATYGSNSTQAVLTVQAAPTVNPPPSNFSGTYTGSYNGTATVNGRQEGFSGAVLATVNGAAMTVTQPAPGNGTITATGQVTFGVVINGSTSCTFSGTFVLTGSSATGSGNFNCTSPTSSGTWNVTRE